MKILKTLWGRFRLLAQHLSFYALAVTMVASIATFWVTVLAPWLIGKGITPHLWMLFLMLVAGGIIIIAFEYNATLPSFYATWNEQMWKHDSPIKQAFEDKEIRDQKRFYRLEQLIKGRTVQDENDIYDRIVNK